MCWHQLEAGAEAVQPIPSGVARKTVVMGNPPSGQNLKQCSWSSTLSGLRGGQKYKYTTSWTATGSLPETLRTQGKKVWQIGVKGVKIGVKIVSHVNIHKGHPCGGEFE